MNRRSFFTKLGLAAASFAILPAAMTYARKWVAPTAQCPMWIPNPAWVTAQYEIAYVWHPIVGNFRAEQAAKDALNPVPQPVFPDYQGNYVSAEV